MSVAESQRRIVTAEHDKMRVQMSVCFSVNPGEARTRYTPGERKFVEIYGAELQRVELETVVGGERFFLPCVIHVEVARRLVDRLLSVDDFRTEVGEKILDDIGHP